MCTSNSNSSPTLLQTIPIKGNGYFTFKWQGNYSIIKRLLISLSPLIHFHCEYKILQAKHPNKNNSSKIKKKKPLNFLKLYQNFSKEKNKKEYQDMD